MIGIERWLSTDMEVHDKELALLGQGRLPDVDRWPAYIHRCPPLDRLHTTAHLRLYVRYAVYWHCCKYIQYML